MGDGALPDRIAGAARNRKAVLKKHAIRVSRQRWHTQIRSVREFLCANVRNAGDMLQEKTSETSIVFRFLQTFCKTISRYCVFRHLLPLFYLTRKATDGGHNGRGNAGREYWRISQGWFYKLPPLKGLIIMV